MISSPPVNRCSQLPTLARATTSATHKVHLKLSLLWAPREVIWPNLSKESCFWPHALELMTALICLNSTGPNNLAYMVLWPPWVLRNPEELTGHLPRRQTSATLYLVNFAIGLVTKMKRRSQLNWANTGIKWHGPTPFNSLSMTGQTLTQLMEHPTLSIRSPNLKFPCIQDLTICRAHQARQASTPPWFQEWPTTSWLMVQTMDSSATTQAKNTSTSWLLSSLLLLLIQWTRHLSHQTIPLSMKVKTISTQVKT